MSINVETVERLAHETDALYCSFLRTEDQAIGRAYDASVDALLAALIPSGPTSSIATGVLALIEAMRSEAAP